MTANAITAAEQALACAGAIVDAATRRLAATAVRSNNVDIDGLDAQQLLAYDLAHVASAIEAAHAMLRYAAYGSFETDLACAFIADTLADIQHRVTGREAAWGIAPDALAPARAFLETYRDPAWLAALGDRVATAGTGAAHLDADFELARETFRRFARDRIRPVAESIHREDRDIPETIIAGLAELGGFALSVPEEFGGFAAGGPEDYLAMVIATEELAWGSLGVGGSLITRPEIVTRALVAGGTETQKQRYLPRIASGELMCGIMVTEPDFGSDVAGLTVTATAVDGGWRINGTKTWCTFAGRADLLLLLARTDPDRSLGHRGLSLFLIEKPPAPGHAFRFESEGGTMEGRAIATLGYRGMHSFEVAFTDWFVPADQLVGGESGLGRGFYLQMEGFENGRLQTAARAVGLMQAAFDDALAYASGRSIFGRTEFSYQLSKGKLARMAMLIAAGRQFSYAVAHKMAGGHGALEASMVKAYVCRAAEWVTREAMQLHGGMGYAEEYLVSRAFVDARVLSIFEGTDEVLCLRVIARRLVEQHLEG
ncbi:MAG: acyl-CoA dehydrogenase family protein [Acidimicrobiia bacterium]